MSTHTARLVWNRTTETMDPKTYARDHQWRFDSGVTIAASAAAGPAIPPGTVGADTVDPEEAVVAALAGCHMLFFLALAAKKGLTRAGCGRSTAGRSIATRTRRTACSRARTARPG